MILFIYRFIICLALFLLQLPLQLLGSILLLPLCYFYNIGYLPLISRWLDSADPFIGRDISTITSVNTQGYWSKYIWLAWRNPLNYFNYKVTGFQFPINTNYEVIGNLSVGDSTNDIPGYKCIQLDTGYYEYLYVKQITTNSCVYFRMGWKIGDLSNKPLSYCQSVFTISYRSYSGK